MLAVLVLPDDGLDRVGRPRELLVVVAEELGADDEVEADPEAGQDEGENDRVAHGQPAAERPRKHSHFGSFRTYPEPRTVWMSFTSAPWSTFRRR